MNTEKQLSQAEFEDMVKYLHRYVNTSMDQWELWSFDSTRGKTYINISLKPDGADDSYTDLNELLK